MITIVLLAMAVASMMASMPSIVLASTNDEEENERQAIESNDNGGNNKQFPGQEKIHKKDINPCLLDPSDPVCPDPDPDTQECPPGYAQNEDGNCFPLHDMCPKGYHSHEDDETGRCIKNNEKCQEGYERDPDFPTCSRIPDQ
jgi:hypothetical protein